MAVRTVYTCDRCGEEQRSPSDLRPFHAVLGDPTSTGDEVGPLDVCRSCGSMLLSVIRSAIENRAAVG